MLEQGRGAEGEASMQVDERKERSYKSLNSFFRKFIHNKEADSEFAHTKHETNWSMRLMPLHRPAIRTMAVRLPVACLPALVI